MSRGDPLKDVSPLSFSCFFYTEVFSCSLPLRLALQIAFYLTSACLCLEKWWWNGCSESMKSSWNPLNLNNIISSRKPPWEFLMAHSGAGLDKQWDLSIRWIQGFLLCHQHVLQIIGYAREEMKKNNISEQTMIGLMWASVMSSVEWNKKEELVAEQAIKLLKVTPSICNCTIPFSHSYDSKENDLKLKCVT